MRSSPPPRANIGWSSVRPRPHSGCGGSSSRSDVTMRIVLTMGLGMLAAASATAQTPSAPAASAPAATAPAVEHPAAWQIAAAVLPLPDSMRAGAAVLGYQNGKLVQLRAGTNQMICLADNPEQKGFETSCYHKALDPF